MVLSVEPLARVKAGFEIFLCSGYPTQIAVAGALRMAGLAPLDSEGNLSAPFVFALSLIDTVLLVGLIVLFLRQSGERARDVLFGRRRWSREAVVGIGFLPVVFAIVVTVMLTVRTLAPGLHNVPENPLTALLGSPLGVLMFVFVVVVAGGLREELQRAFLLHRFSHHLGGPWVGLAVTSIAFGLGHTVQGWDAAIVTGVLGAAWGLLYLRRKSAIAGVVSHALFNSSEVLRASLAGSL